MCDAVIISLMRLIKLYHHYPYPLFSVYISIIHVDYQNLQQDLQKLEN